MSVNTLDLLANLLSCGEEKSLIPQWNSFGSGVVQVFVDEVVAAASALTGLPLAKVRKAKRPKTVGRYMVNEEVSRCDVLCSNCKIL